jgi:predicted Fe-S protein YdhL (DUF1289 family)
MSNDSPCIDVCTFDGRTGWCDGCGRTIPEVRAWRKLKPFARQRLLSELPKRVARLKSQADGKKA